MTDERHDDEVLGRALSRAIETQTPNETPFERSRIADQPARRGFSFWQFAGVAAALVLALAFGSWFTRPSDTGPGVAASPTSAASATATPTAPTSAATVTPSAAPTAVDHSVVYFARDGLPPVGVHIRGSAAQSGIATQSTADQRIASRVSVIVLNPDLQKFAGADPIPAAAFNAIRRPPNVAGVTGVTDVKVQGDLATVDLRVTNDDWGIHGAAATTAAIQQLVYTATEEPGIRRVLITQNGGKPAKIDQLTLDKPMSREDVFGYAMGSTKTAQGFGDANGPTRKLTLRTSVDTVAAGLARVVIETDLQQVAPSVLYPDFKVDVIQDTDPSKPLGAKWYLRVSVTHGVGTPELRVIDQTPLRSVSAMQLASSAWNGTVLDIGLDDLRPWRTAIAYNPFRIIIDIGGEPQTIDGNNAVYAPAPGSTVGRTFQVSGIAHNFEANVVIRVRDDKQKEIYKASTTATNCCDPGGTFDTTVQLPANVTGNIYLEVFEASARDGSDTKLIRIPLTVR